MKKIILSLCLIPFSFSVAQTPKAIINAFESASREFSVPADVLKGIAFAESRWQQLTWAEGDTASCTGMPHPYGIMSLWDNQYFGHSLNEAASLIGEDPSVLKANMLQNIRGAAALLRKYHDELPLPDGTKADDIESWRNAIAVYSGLPKVELAQQHALDIYSAMSVGYHHYHIDWNARPVNLQAMRVAVRRIQSEARAARVIRGNTTQSVTAQPDYPLAKWASAYPGHWYENGWDAQYGQRFVVIHDMEGYYLSTISYFQMSSTQASIHYCVNGLQDNSSDAPAGEITQMVEERNAAWHVRCWNRYMFGIEHEGFVSNPAWFTDDLYKSSAQLTAYLCNKYNIPMDRNHIIGHDEWENGNWTSWMATNYPMIDYTCNSHTDPGVYWDWTYYMNLVRGDTLPPKVVSTYPATNALSVRAYSRVVVTFSSFMDTASADQAFSITPAVSGSLSWSADFRTMTFTPAGFLAFNSTYTIKIDSTARNKAFGYALDGNGDTIAGDPFQFTFTTEQPDTTPPVIVGTYPHDNSVAVPTFAEPIITLNEPLQPSSLNSRIVLLDSTNATIPISGVTPDTLNNQGIITFATSSLAPHASYVLKVLAGLKDVYGNASSSEYVIHFTTAPSVVVQGIVFDGFESNARSWIQPNSNSATTGDDSAKTWFSFSPDKVKSGTFSGKLTYRFSEPQGSSIVLEAGASPVIDSYSTLGLWVWGDVSGNRLDITFQPQNQSFVVDSIDWRGWKFINIPLSTISGPGRKFSSIVVHQQNGSSTSGVLYFDDMQVNSVVNGVGTRQGGVPTRFVLEQNYPNPFNPSTIIQYQVPVESQVRLTVFNILGQSVRLLVDEHKTPGSYTCTFDASGLPSGVYFYRLEASGFHDVQKMLLLR